MGGRVNPQPLSLRARLAVRQHLTPLIVVHASPGSDLHTAALAASADIVVIQRADTHARGANRGVHQSSCALSWSRKRLAFCT